MSERVQLPEVAAMTPEQTTVYLRFPSNLARALLLTRDSASAHFDLGASFTRGLLSFVDREVIVMRVAKLVDSAFERMIHYPLAKKAGLSDGDIEDIEAGRVAGMAPERAALVTYVSECITQTKASLPAFQALAQYYNQHEIAEATHLAGHCWMTAMYLASLDIPLDEQETSWDRLGSTPARAG